MRASMLPAPRRCANIDRRSLIEDGGVQKKPDQRFEPGSWLARLIFGGMAPAASDKGRWSLPSLLGLCRRHAAKGRVNQFDMVYGKQKCPHLYWFPVPSWCSQ